MAVENSKVLIIVNNWGIEETELTRPLRDLKAAGAQVTLAAITLDPCETVQHDRYEGETLTPDALLSDVQASDYDLLVVPRRHLQCGSHSRQRGCHYAGAGVRA